MGLHSGGLPAAGRSDLPLDKWSLIALQEDWIGRWTQSAMFPSELVFFLALCEHSGIKRIFESGRYEGTRRSGWPPTPSGKAPTCIRSTWNLVRTIAQRGRERLSKYPVCAPHDGRHLSGAWQHHAVPSGRACGTGRGRAETLRRHERALCRRRLPVDSRHRHAQPRREARHRGVLHARRRRPRYYEDYAKNPDGVFARLRASELEQLSAKVQRPLDRSSLAVMKVDDAARQQLLWTMDRRFGRHQPLVLYWRWRLRHLRGHRLNIDVSNVALKGAAQFAYPSQDDYVSPGLPGLRPG